MAGQLRGRLLGLEVPQCHLVIKAGRSQEAAVGGEGQAQDKVLFSLEPKLFAASGCVPDGNATTAFAGGGHGTVVRAESDAAVAGEMRQGAAAGYVPQPDFQIQPNSGERAAIRG